MDPRHPRAPLVVLATVTLLFAGCADDPGEAVVAPQEAAFSTATVDAPATTGNHLVLFRAEAIPGGFAAEVARLGGEVEKTFAPVGIAVVSGLDEQEAATLERARAVRSVEPDVIMSLEEVDMEAPAAEEDSPDLIDPTVTVGGATAAAEDDPESIDPTNAFFYPRQWHHRAIFADAAWAAGYLGSSDVVVSIVDTGLDYTHASLEGRVDLDRSISLHRWDDAAVDTLFPDAHPIADLNRHGTHVGATVVSTGEVGAGVTAYTTLFGVKVCGWRVGCPRGAVLHAIMYSADRGADIINLSLGGTFLRSADRGGWLPFILRVTNYAHRAGALVVVSAGNGALDLDHDGDGFKTYCSATNVVCVAGTGPTMRESRDGPWDDFDQPYFRTNYGRSAIDVAAPSGNYNNFVYAACSSFSMNSTVCQRSDRFIIGLRGTSMAAPHVSGVAALIAAHADGARGNPGMIRNRLHQTSDKVSGTGSDPYFGKGRINAAKAVGLE